MTSVNDGETDSDRRTDCQTAGETVRTDTENGVSP